MGHAGRLGLAWVLTAIMTALIARFTLVPPGGGGPLPINDKLAHFIAFALLALPLAWALPARWGWVVGAAIFFGAVIEVIQPNFGRAMEALDLLADGAGAFIGAGMGLMLAQLRRA